MDNVYIILFNDFEPLDVFGPVEVLGNVDQYQLHYLSMDGGEIRNRQGIRILTEPLSAAKDGEILLIPGGMGTRTMIKDAAFIRELRRLIGNAACTLCVCTGSALAAETGALDGKRATSNKTAFAWVTNTHPSVCWDKNARWTADGPFYTSAGVSAGTDMALGFIRDRFGEAAAEEICRRMEYHWNKDADHDIF